MIPINPLELTDERARLGITRLVMELLDAWQLKGEDARHLLSLPDNLKLRMLHKYRQGQAAFPKDPKVLRSSYYLLRIADALRTAYPHNPHMVNYWVHKPNQRFGRRTPLSIMIGRGESGLIAVLSELDCTFSWDLTGSSPVV